MRELTHIRIPHPINQSDDEQLWRIVLDEKNTVLSMDVMESVSCPQGESWNGDWLSPMGLDLQINGGLGLAFSELTFQDLPKLSDLLDKLWIDGVDCICPTIVSSEINSLRLSLEVLKQARNKHISRRCKLLGAHLEGPFIADSRRGAHSDQYLSLPGLEDLNERIKDFEEEIDLVTLAPELPGSFDLIKRLIALKIVVCLGHSTADEFATRQAFAEGVSMLTHAFNAMPGLHHRAPGPLGEALKNGQISIGLIADGVHVHPTLAILLQRLAEDKLVLVSDAISPYGLEDGEYKWDQRCVVSAEGTCRLKNGTLVGTTLPLLETAQKLAKWSKEPSASIWSATISPRLVLDKGQRFTSFFVGQSLHQLLRWRMNWKHSELSWQPAA